MDLTVNRFQYAVLAPAALDGKEMDTDKGL